MNKMEEEVVYLTAVVEMIRSMVNHELMVIRGEGDHKSIQFKGMTHQQFFFIALVDFLSKTDAKAPVPSATYLSALRGISDTPSFSVGNSVSDLRKSVNIFADWLNEKITVALWLPSLDLETEVQISRLLLLKIVGNVSKHNTLRSVGVAADLRSLLQEAGHDFDLFQAMLAQEEIYESFHDNVSMYHASTIVEFLNNIYWGIQNYLLPEYSRSFTPDGGGSSRYKFLYPDTLENPYARHCYWGLMNQIRSEPIFEPFTVTEHLKGQY